MQPKFNIDRERHNQLFYKEYTNDKCVFQFHSHIELYFVEEGQMDFLVGGHHRTLSAGEMSVALSYESHAYKTPQYSKSSVFSGQPNVEKGHRADENQVSNTSSS